MNEKSDIRWRQRFQNLGKAMENLRDATAIVRPTDIERAGIIQYYEVAFELSWKTMKDYLVEEGFTVHSPRATIKQAAQAGMIDDGALWLTMLDKRNELTHTYDEETARDALASITQDYISQLNRLFEWLKRRNEE